MNIQSKEFLNPSLSLLPITSLLCSIMVSYCSGSFIYVIVYGQSLHSDASSMKDKMSCSPSTCFAGGCHIADAQKTY